MYGRGSFELLRQRFLQAAWRKHESCGRSYNGSSALSVLSSKATFLRKVLPERLREPITQSKYLSEEFVLTPALRTLCVQSSELLSTESAEDPPKRVLDTIASVSFLWLMALSSISPRRCQRILWFSQRRLLLRQSFSPRACGWLPPPRIDHQGERAESYSVPIKCFAFR